MIQERRLLVCCFRLAPPEADTAGCNVTFLSRLSNFRLKPVGACALGSALHDAWGIATITGDMSPLEIHFISHLTISFEQNRCFKIVNQLVKKLSAFYGARRFISVFTAAFLEPDTSLIQLNSTHLSMPLSSEWSLSIRFIGLKHIHTQRNIVQVRELNACIRTLNIQDVSRL
jgi:hypothetical protein